MLQNANGITPEKKAEYEKYMREALELAKLCAFSEDVPVGAVVVFEGKVIGRGYNVREKTRSPLWHAEMAAVEEAAKALGCWNLTGTTLLVTKEPCAMCAGLIVQSRISEVVFGVSDAKGGGCGGALQIAASEKLNHRAVLISGILEDECLSILQTFFKKRRIKT
ncbi:MAG TPA: nucleoside deaminase [Candidatus Wallbacteria bacterium]|nr:nucleoside deaminase [Candidatus Wallbacteria bacterium]